MIVAMPTEQTGRNVPVSPFALACATVCFLASLAVFVLMIIYQPDAADKYLRPIGSYLVTLGGVALLWWRQSRSQVQHSSENAVIIKKADTAAESAGKAEQEAAQVAEEVKEKLNGGLDKRLQDAIEAALERYEHNTYGKGEN